MKLNIINTPQRLVNILGAKGKSKKGFVLSKSTGVKITSTGLALILFGSTVLAPTKENNNDLTETQTVVSEATIPNEDKPTDQKYGLLAEEIPADVSMNTNMVPVDEQAQQIAEEMGATYDGPVYSTTDENGKQQNWVSQDDYNKAVDAGIADAPVGTEKTTYDEEVFVADDGTPFKTKADMDAWNAHLKDEKTGNTNKVVETEGNYYVAPDGSLWTSEAEYNKNQNNNTNNTAENNSEYQDPNGEWWTSEAEYLAYLNSLNNVFGTPTNNGTITTSPEVTPGVDVSYDDNFYHAPDGTVWSDEAEYKSYINSTTNSNTLPNDTTNNNVYDNTTSTDVSYEGNYYQAPDGSLWSSEAEYLASLNIGNTVTDNTDQNNNYYEETGTGSVDYEDDNLYQAPDGTVWASEKDYNDYIDSQNTTTYNNSVEYSEMVGTNAGDTYGIGSEETDTTNTKTTEETVQEESRIQYDQYGGYVDPATGYYFVYDIATGEFLGAYESQAAYLEIVALESDQKTR